MDKDEVFIGKRKSGFIQISPSMEGPWTTVRLHYAAPAACWRLGNDVIASEVGVTDGNIYVNMRSLVSVRNNTDFILELCLVPKTSKENIRNIRSLSIASEPEGLQIDGSTVQTDEIFETENYNPSLGWVGYSNYSDGGDHNQVSNDEYLFVFCVPHTCLFMYLISNSEYICTNKRTKDLPLRIW
jgi:vacuolar protein sorting-associated protein 13A/C